jgi:hypothetical protein
MDDEEQKDMYDLPPEELGFAHGGWRYVPDDIDADALARLKANYSAFVKHVHDHGVDSLDYERVRKRDGGYKFKCGAPDWVVITPESWWQTNASSAAIWSSNQPMVFVADRPFAFWHMDLCSVAVRDLVGAMRLCGAPDKTCAKRHGGWRNIPADVDAETFARLRAQYTDFMASAPLGAAHSIEWVCVTPESWRVCDSYAEAVSQLRACGVGVVDRKQIFWNADLCNGAAYEARRRAACAEYRAQLEAQEAELEAALEAEAELEAAAAAAPPPPPPPNRWVFKTSISREELERSKTMTVDDYYRFLAANPDVYYDGF